MDIKVTTTEVIIDSGYIANKGEYNVNPCNFTFVEQYDGLVKKAKFIVGSTEIERAIINDKCDIPYDVLDSEMFELHVYAYEVDNELLVLRYSPTYAKVFLREGSYRGVTGSGEVITPTQYEQYEAALNEGLQEAQNVDINISKSGNITTITIKNRDGTEKSEQVSDGTDYVITYEDYEQIVNMVLREIGPEIPYKESQLQHDMGYITADTDELQFYYKKSETYNKTEVDNKISSVYKYKGSVATYQDLPYSGLTIGDVYNVESNGKNYAWNGTAWDDLGGNVDLSNYYTKTQTDGFLNNKVDKVEGKGLSTNDYTAEDKQKVSSSILATSYATSSTGGTIKVKSENGIEVGGGIAEGELRGATKTYTDYSNGGTSNGLIVCKGTLNNVLNAVIGDLPSVLDAINGEVI